MVSTYRTLTRDLERLTDTLDKYLHRITGYHWNGFVWDHGTDLRHRLTTTVLAIQVYPHSLDHLCKTIPTERGQGYAHGVCDLSKLMDPVIWYLRLEGGMHETYRMGPWGLASWGGWSVGECDVCPNQMTGWHKVRRQVLKTKGCPQRGKPRWVNILKHIYFVFFFFNFTS